MNDTDIPLLKKAYELYKAVHEYRPSVPKQDRYTIYERVEGIILDVIEHLYYAGYAKSANKIAILEKTSAKLNLLRLLVRLMKDTKTITSKKYVAWQELIDEIGRMLGGWMRSIK